MKNFELTDKDGKPITISMRMPLGKEAKAILLKMKGIDDDDPEGMFSFTLALEELAATLCNTTVEALDELPTDQKQPLIDEVATQVFGSLDFTKRFRNVQHSG